MALDAWRTLIGIITFGPKGISAKTMSVPSPSWAMTRRSCSYYLRLSAVSFLASSHAGVPSTRNASPCFAASPRLGTASRPQHVSFVSSAISPTTSNTSFTSTTFSPTTQYAHTITPGHIKRTGNSSGNNSPASAHSTPTSSTLRRSSRNGTTAQASLAFLSLRTTSPPSISRNSTKNERSGCS